MAPVKRLPRERSYEPPFSGGRPQLKSEFRAIHPRWIAWLREHPPAAVPLDEGGWPATFGNFIEEVPQHDLMEGDGYCFQCGGCQYYILLESALGSDYGACSHAKSEYDGHIVFEHWTCRVFTA